jgi:hypothetical protein
VLTIVDNFAGAGMFPDDSAASEEGALLEQGYTKTGVGRAQAAASPANLLRIATVGWDEVEGMLIRIQSLHPLSQKTLKKDGAPTRVGTRMRREQAPSSSLCSASVGMTEPHSNIMSGA